MLLFLLEYRHVPETERNYGCYTDGENTVYFKHSAPTIKKYQFFNVPPGKGKGSNYFKSKKIKRMYAFLLKNHP